jgi:signal peptidase I
MKGDFEMKNKKVIPVSDEEMKNNPEIQEEEVQVVKKESTVKRVISTIINVVLVVAIVLAAGATYMAYVESTGNGTPSILGIQMLSVQTDSMYPTLKPGDLIFSTTVKDPSDLKVDDVITYWTVING